MVSPTTSSPASDVTGGRPVTPGATASVGTGRTRSQTRRRLLAIGWNLLPPLTFVAIVALWAGSVRLFGIPAYLLPGPGAVFQRLITDAGLLWSNALVTLSEIVLGFALTIVTAIPLGLMIALSPLAKQILYPRLCCCSSCQRSQSPRSSWSGSASAWNQRSC